MIEVGLVWVLIAGELFFVLAGSLAILLVLAVKQRRRDRQAAMYLVKVVKDNEPKRLDATRSLLEQKYGLSGESLDCVAHDIMHAEKLLFQRVINLYVKRDVISLRELNIDVEAMTEPFRKLEPGNGVSAGSNAADDEQGDADALRADNEALKQELQITMETMSRMLSEYTGMFGNVSQAQAGQVQEVPDASTADEDAAVESTGLGSVEDGLQELDDEPSAVDGPEDEFAADATVLVPQAAADENAEVDLSQDDLDMVFGDQDMDLDLDAEEPPAARKDAEGADIDDDLADMWAEALGEQDETEEKKS